MPGFDKTGPAGQGRLLGSGFGQCNNVAQGDEVAQDTEYGVGRGSLPRGGGRGRRRRSGAISRDRGCQSRDRGCQWGANKTIDTATNAAAVEDQMKNLEHENEVLRLKLAELESKG